MIMKVCVYKDTKLNVFCQPFFVDGNATREDLIEITRRACANPEMPLRNFEFDLYYLGEYDDKVGKISSVDAEFLVSLGDFRYLCPKKEESEDVQQIS